MRRGEIEKVESRLSLRNRNQSRFNSGEAGTALKNADDPILRLTYLAGLMREALAMADNDKEHLVGVKVDEALAVIRERIEQLKIGRS
jgi:hypothetical protein